ncbi:hypothetical protein HDU86_003669 [Geranomyces michiganensis]|nr:hypothetical protein HDU86_003669 [Geranomyces michiganensis]
MRHQFVVLASLACAVLGAPAAIDHSLERRALADDIAATTAAIDRAQVGLAAILDSIAKAVGNAGAANGAGTGGGAQQTGTAGKAAESGAPTVTQGTAGAATTTAVATKTKGNNGKAKGKGKATETATAVTATEGSAKGKVTEAATATKGNNGKGNGNANANKTKAVPPGQAKKTIAAATATATAPAPGAGNPATETGAAPAPTAGAEAVTDVKPALTTAGIIPDVIKDITPAVALSIKYPVGAVTLGNNITPAQAAAQPVFAFTPRAENDLHTLLMVDPDVPSRAAASPAAGQFRHMALLNIRGADVASALAASPYVGPGPPKGSGPHRYTFLLFRQQAEISAAAAGISAANRAGFKAQAFADKLGLELIGANFMLSENP